MTIGARLKGERKRLGLTQPTLGAYGGVEKLTQFCYEGGKSFPNADYLAKVAASGVDVLYVVTGERNANMPGMAFLDPKHQTLIARYDAATDENKKIIEGVACLAAQQSASRL